MLLTIKEVSAWLNIKESTLYLWAATGKIPCQRIHGLIRFDRDVITRWLASLPQAPSVKAPRIPHRRQVADADRLIAAAKRDVYTPGHGETISPSPSRKEDEDGAR
jgi:excisionase family DNA binding protein